MTDPSQLDTPRDVPGQDAPIQAAAQRMDLSELDALLAALQARGYETIGPRARDGAIVYASIERAADLPIGLKDVQAAGSYRLERRTDAARFGYTAGPQSLKAYLHPPALRLFSASKTEAGFELDDRLEPVSKRAFIGVRACELNAVLIQDKVFLGGDYQDPHYAARRAAVFIVAVNCTEAGATCFCASLNTGPQVGAGFDLALSEIIGSDEHYFLIEAGSEAGAELLAALTTQPATSEELARAQTGIETAKTQMGLTLQTGGLKELLYDNLEHPRWEEVAERCLNCGNCTLVCPTCFCTTVDDLSDLAGKNAERVRRWDSCFTSDFSYIHGGSVRDSGAARYRQWLTHKFASWQDQFGTLGCVGCGRCVTWCPVGIDVTEELGAIRISSGKIPEVRIPEATISEAMTSQTTTSQAPTSEAKIAEKGDDRAAT